MIIQSRPGIETCMLPVSLGDPKFHDELLDQPFFAPGPNCEEPEEVEILKMLLRDY